MQIRSYSPHDAESLYGVFSSAVRGLACADYSPEQIDAWAPLSIDLHAWSARLLRSNPLVVEHGGAAIAYAALLPNGYIDDFYVSAAHAHQGVGNTLMRSILANAADLGLVELFSDVSITAQPFFAKFGFRIVEQRMPVVRGVALPNARMLRPSSQVATRSGGITG